MSRCKSCNVKLYDTEMYIVDDETGQIEDMCSVCKSYIYQEYDYINDHEYHHNSLQEGLTSPTKSSY